MDKYRLKPDARKFFDKKLHHENQKMIWWQKYYGIPIELLDEVEMVYIDYGHSYKLESGTKTANLQGWQSDGRKARFHFTVKIDDIEHKDYDKINLADVMQEIQTVLNDYFTACVY